MNVVVGGWSFFEMHAPVRADFTLLPWFFSTFLQVSQQVCCLPSVPSCFGVCFHRCVPFVFYVLAPQPRTPPLFFNVPCSRGLARLRTSLSRVNKKKVAFTAVRMICTTTTQWYRVFQFLLSSCFFFFGARVLCFACACGGSVMKVLPGLQVQRGSGARYSDGQDGPGGLRERRGVRRGTTGYLSMCLLCRRSMRWFLLLASPLWTSLLFCCRR